MLALLGFGTNLLAAATTATALLVAVKHGWELWQSVETERERRAKKDTP